VIDLRSLKPLDEASLLRSMRKTGRLLVVHEASGLCGMAAEIAALAATQGLRCLARAGGAADRPGRAGASSWALEQAAVPQVDAVALGEPALQQDQPRLEVVADVRQP
jgi:acetoin:2,6-dichlorophenolindophenol oxidoreductase subunit beta